MTDKGSIRSIAMVCKGSLSEGLGHVTRSAAVARELIQLDATVQMLTVGDESATNILRDESIPYRVVSSESEVEEALAHDPFSAVIFDLTTLDQALFDHLTSGRLAVSISPVFEHQVSVDLSFSRTQHEPDKTLRSQPDRHRRDLAYTVVSERCRVIPHSVYASSLYEDPLSIGVSMGGSDAPNKTQEVLAALREVRSPLLLWVMLGEGYAHSYESLVETIRSDRRHEVILAKTTRSMWTVLQRCSLAVLAGGVTSYEAAYAGLPSINILESTDDAFLLQELQDLGIAISLPPEPSRKGRLVETIETLEADRDQLFLMHRRASGAIDGKGAGRIASEIIKRIGPQGNH